MGAISTYVRDSMNRLRATVDPVSNRTSFTFDSDGALLTTKTPLGYVTTNIYSSTGLLRTVVDPAGGRVTYGYDARKQPHHRGEPA